MLGWTVAQFLKTVIDMVINKSFNPERIFGSGGMPSSHSATVCALTTASGMKYGVGSFEFAISFVLSMIVMYDAMGVRRETGKQAKLLNSVFFENILNLDGVFLQEKLKEYVGHTPLQVVAGAVLGILLAVLTGKSVSYTHLPLQTDRSAGRCKRDHDRSEGTGPHRSFPVRWRQGRSVPRSC